MSLDNLIKLLSCEVNLTFFPEMYNVKLGINKIIIYKVRYILIHKKIIYCYFCIVIYNKYLLKFISLFYLFPIFIYLTYYEFNLCYNIFVNYNKGW